MFFDGKQNMIHYLNQYNQNSLKTDLLITQYSQVNDLAEKLARHFLISPYKTDKIVVNVADTHNCSNIGGFNLANFQAKYLENYFDDVVQDYN